MATTLPKSDRAAAEPKASKPSRGTPRKKGSDALGKVLLFLVLAGLLSAAVWGSGQYLGSFTAKKADTALTHTVRRGELLVTVTEDGNLESASNLDIKCQVAGGTSILWIIPDGSEVKAGDKLVELDSAALEESINQQRILYEKARSTRIQAEKTFEVAKLAVREYLEGTFKKELQDAEKLITISMENLRSAQNSMEHAERMFRKGYVSNLELEGQRFAVERAQLELDSATTARDVLVNFTKVKMLQDLESQRDTAEAQMKSEMAAFDLEESRLKRLEAQLEQCTITAPTDGMVVYANEQRGRFGQDQSAIEEGAAVRERQTILKLPDLSKMQVKVNVHESKVEQLRAGMRARIRILDREKTGSVTNIANQPEPSGWFAANVKEYATFVRVEGDPENLRPGMTAEVEILVAHLKDVISLPVAAVVEQGGEYVCWVKEGDSIEKRRLELGLSNDRYIEVKDGVSEGEVVLLNPRAVVPDARGPLVPVEETGVDVNKRFGEAPAGQAAGGPGEGDLDGPSGPRGRGEPGGGPDGPGGTPGAGGPGAGPGLGGPGGGGQDAGPGGSGGRRGGRRDLMQMDTDGDGKVSREEAPEPMQGFFDRLDSNADGFIDRAEADAARQRFRGGGGPGGPGGPDGSGGGPGAPPAGGANG
jgi:RND family efflux transporter MFP subunit